MRFIIGAFHTDEENSRFLSFSFQDKLMTKLVDSNGEPVYGDGWGETGSDDSEDPSDVDLSYWTRALDILQRQPLYNYESWYNSCVRFNPPDVICGTTTVVSDIVYKSEDEVSKKLVSSSGESYSDLASALYDKWTKSTGESNFYLRTEVMCAQNSNGTQCYTGIPSYCEPPCVDQKSSTDFLALDLSIAKDYVYVEHRFSDELLESQSLVSGENVDDFFISAISLLALNTDIISWIICRIMTADFEGNTKDTGDLDKCLLQYITGEKNIQFKLRTGGLVCSGSIFAWVVPPGNGINICINSSSWNIYWSVWQAAKNGLSISPTSDMASILIDFSASILHELTHVCWKALLGKHGDAGTAGSCGISYRTENMFRWAMYTRYAFSTNSQCMPNSLPVSAMWGVDSSIFSSSNCLPPD